VNRQQGSDVRRGARHAHHEPLAGHEAAMKIGNGCCCLAQDLAFDPQLSDLFAQPAQLGPHDGRAGSAAVQAVAPWIGVPSTLSVTSMLPRVALE
jgi:hypothetical protein